MTSDNLEPPLPVEEASLEATVTYLDSDTLPMTALEDDFQELEEQLEATQSELFRAYAILHNAYDALALADEAYRLLPSEHGSPNHIEICGVREEILTFLTDTSAAGEPLGI